MITRSAASCATTVGLNTTVIVQLAPLAKVAIPPVGGIQVFCCEKLTVSLSVIAEIVSGAVPVLVRVTLCDGLAVVTAWFTGKVSVEAGATLI